MKGTAGGFPVFLMASFAYCADVTPPNLKQREFGRVEAALYFGNFVIKKKTKKIGGVASVGGSFNEGNGGFFFFCCWSLLGTFDSLPKKNASDNFIFLCVYLFFRLAHILAVRQLNDELRNI